MAGGASAPPESPTLPPKFERLHPLHQRPTFTPAYCITPSHHHASLQSPTQAFTNDAATAIAKHQNNGLNQRTGWQYDVDSSATLSTSEQFYFVFDDRWRIVATVRAGDANPKATLAYHLSGLASFGGSPYIDRPITRDEDANNAWTTASEDTLEDRVYDVQNEWHFLPGSRREEFANEESCNVLGARCWRARRHAFARQ